MTQPEAIRRPVESVTIDFGSVDILEEVKQKGAEKRVLLTNDKLKEIMDRKLG